MKREKKKVCLIASAGGHLEQIRQLKDVIERYDTYYVVPRVKSTEKMKQKKYLVDDMVRTNKIVLILYFIKMCFQQLYIFIKERPDVILTTGAGVAIPTCLIAKVCRKKIIYIESFARISTPNKTGTLIYKFADLFIVQWESLLKYYPNAVYGGGGYIDGVCYGWFF